MFEGGKDDSRCRLCGAKLSLIQRLSRAEFCSAEHQNAFKRDQERLALERLGLTGTGAPAAPVTAPDAEPEPEPEVAADGQYESFIIDGPAEEPVFEEHTPAMASFLFQGSYATYGTIPCMEECDPIGGSDLSCRLPSLRPRGSWSGGWSPTGVSDRLFDVARSSQGSMASAWLEPAEIDFAGVMTFPGGPDPIPFSPTDAGIKGVQPEPGDPPMAGLAPLPGPQTLRFEPAICRTEAVPEEPVAPEPSKDIRQQERKKPARLRLAGNVRGIWRTRIGQAGQFTPRSEDFIAPAGASGTASIPRFGLRVVESSLLGGSPVESEQEFEVADELVAEEAAIEVQAGAEEQAAEQQAPAEQQAVDAAPPAAEPERPAEPPKAAAPPPAPKPDPMRSVSSLFERLPSPPKTAAPPKPVEQPKQTEQVDLAFVPKADRLPIRLTAPEVKTGPWLVTPLDLIWFKLAHVKSEIEAGLKPGCDITWAPLDVAAVKGRDPLAQPLPARLLAAVRLPKAPKRKKTPGPERALRRGGEVPVFVASREMAPKLAGSEPDPPRFEAVLRAPVVARSAKAEIRPIEDSGERKLVSVFVSSRDCGPTAKIHDSDPGPPFPGREVAEDRERWRLRLLGSEWWSAKARGSNSAAPRVPVAKGPSMWEIEAPPPPVAAMSAPMACAFDTGGDAWDSQI